jgi:hypothetical protein
LIYFFIYCHLTINHTSEYNVSNELANFLLLSLDMTGSSYTKFVSGLLPAGVYASQIAQQNEELNNIIEANGLSGTLDLFHRLAKTLIRTLR